MKSDVRHPLAEEYLARLRRAASRLPRSQRAELMEELTAHVDAAAREAGGDADLRNMLDDLGDPDDIVAAALPAARDEPGPTGRLAFGLGLGALVTGLFALLPVSLPLGVAAAVIGVGARRRVLRAGGATGLATTGIALGIVGACIPLVYISLLTPVRTGSSDEPTIAPESTVVVESTVPG